MPCLSLPCKQRPESRKASLAPISRMQLIDPVSPVAASKAGLDETETHRLASQTALQQRFSCTVAQMWKWLRVRNKYRRKYRL